MISSNINYSPIFKNNRFLNSSYPFEIPDTLQENNNNNKKDKGIVRWVAFYHCDTLNIKQSFEKILTSESWCTEQHEDNQAC